MLDQAALRATPERLEQAHGGFEADPTGRHRITEAPLDRLWKDGRITRREYEAGEKLRAVAYLAAIDPGASTVDWNAAGGAGRSGKIPTMFTTQHIADARIAFRQVEKEIYGTVWTVLKLGLIKEATLPQIGQVVFGESNERYARIAGAAGFRMALAALANYYRIG